MRRSYFVPEVLQTSSMDCGPAALKAICGGYGIYLSYGRLREACQTDIDGTSIDTLEEVLVQLGLDAEQSMLPADVLLLKGSTYLPAIVVTRLPDGAPHFVVIWRVHGRHVQIMDPAAGRLWVDKRRLLDSLYIHEQLVPRSAWEEWARSETFAAGIAQRLRDLGLPRTAWPDPVQHDAALRLAGALRSVGRLERGAETRELLALCAANPGEIPAQCWCGRANDTEQVLLRGAVLLSVKRSSDLAPEHVLPPALASARREPPPRAWAPVWQAVREGGWRWPAAIALALLISALGAVFEAFVFRGFFDLAAQLDSNAQRSAAGAALGLFLCALLALDMPTTLSLLQLGRHLEGRLRIRFQHAVPRLGDRYLQSRLISDMAHRAHALQLLRQLPELVGQLLRLVAALLITAFAISWLFPGAALLAWLAVALACGVPLLCIPALAERDLRLRETQAALSRFQLDAMRGAVALRAHGAERTLRAAQVDQLALWAQAGLRRQNLMVWAEIAQAALVGACVIGIVWRHAVGSHDLATLLLLAYWAASIPLLGRELAALAWGLPGQRSTMLRFLEPLGAPSESAERGEPVPTRGGTAIEFRDVSLMAGGHIVLDGVNLRVRAGEHLGIVGASGAGKSALVGLLLGWHQRATGEIEIDGVPLDMAILEKLRRVTAWIDPQVHLFRTTLLDNLCYGNGNAAGTNVGPAIARAGLEQMLARLPLGLQTPLGDAGVLLSGGEGQAVRMARALARPGVRLAILDEAARGLDRPSRQRFLQVARERFAGATMLCISHDIADTLELDRVIVVDGGRIVEQGRPGDLQEDPASHYRRLLEQESEVARMLWAHPAWRRLSLHEGTLSESQVATR